MRKMKDFSVSIVFLTFLTVITLLLLFLPKSEFSQNEKRQLAQFPTVSAEKIASGEFGTEFETYLADQFPLRDMFFGIHAYTELYTGRNGASGIYAGQDGYLIAAPETLDQERAARNVKRLEAFAKENDLPAVLIPVPTAGYVLSDKLPKNHLAYMDDAAFSVISANAGNMEVIDLRETLRQSEVQVYYRTDHHLTSAGSYEMYQAYCSAVGIIPRTFACMQINDGFYGTGYSKSGLWLKEPDTLEIWEPEEPSAYTVTITDNGTSATYNGLYFPEHLENMDQYPVFLDGNHELTVIENQSVRNGKRMLLIKDSYAHCFATFAAEEYETICMVDLRYFRGMVSDLIETYGLTEILYLYGVENLTGSTDIGWLM